VLDLAWAGVTVPRWAASEGSATGRERGSARGAAEADARAGLALDGGADCTDVADADDADFRGDSDSRRGDAVALADRICEAALVTDAADEASADDTESNCKVWRTADTDTGRAADVDAGTDTTVNSASLRLRFLISDESASISYVLTLICPPACERSDETIFPMCVL
jgi:hypothetical protein